jgi:predicted Zn-dependent protease
MRRLLPIALLTLAGCTAPGDRAVGSDWVATPLTERARLTDQRNTRRENDKRREANLAEVEAAPRKLDRAGGGFAEGDEARATGTGDKGALERLMRAERWAEALELVERALLKAPDTALLLSKGQILLHLSRPSPAADTFQAVLNAEPNNPEALFGRARTALALGRAKASLSFIKRLKAQGDVDPAVHRLEAMVLEALGDTAGALAALEAAGSSDSLAVLARGNARARAGDAAGATADLARAATEHPKDASVQLQYGTALAQTGKLAEAAKALQAATQLAPDSTQAWRNLASVRERLGDRAGAAQAWANLLKNAPNADPSGRIKTRIERLQTPKAPPQGGTR